MRSTAFVFAFGFISVLTVSCGETKACDAMTCATGCCDSMGQCQNGSNSAACGTLGNQCNSCGVVQFCSLGTCQSSNTNSGGGTASSAGGTAATGGGTESSGGGTSSSGGGSISLGGGAAVMGGGTTASGGGSTSMGGGANSAGGMAGGSAGGASNGVVPSVGCSMAAMPAGFTTKTISVAGATRTYKLFVPTAYNAQLPIRLVFVFHGLGGDSTQIRSYFSIETEAAGQAIFVYPDGVVRLGGRTGWDRADLPFFDAMLTELTSTYCVDTTRVFAMGHSFGGYMTNQLGCERNSVIRAIAPVSGGLGGGAVCSGSIAAWMTHGDADTVVAQSQGILARNQWLQSNGCATTNQPTTPTPCVSYDGCSTGRPVIWCPFSGGHYPPFPAFVKPGIWNFFKAF
jgi:polyhydroxybutyrate depolymerase